MPWLRTATSSSLSESSWAAVAVDRLRRVPVRGGERQRGGRRGHVGVVAGNGDADAARAADRDGVQRDRVGADVGVVRARGLVQRQAVAAQRHARVGGDRRGVRDEVAAVPVRGGEHLHGEVARAAEVAAEREGQGGPDVALGDRGDGRNRDAGNVGDELEARGADAAREGGAASAPRPRWRRAGWLPRAPPARSRRGRPPARP